MKLEVKQSIKHPLIRGSVIVVFGNLAANFFNFLFNLYMGRNLSIADYGTLASVISLIGFPVLAGSAIVPLVVRFSGNYFATGQLNMVKGLYIKIAKFLFLIAISICVVFLFSLSQINNFFHLNNTFILILTDVIIFFSLISIINLAFLQAKLAFTFQVLLNIIGSVLKLILGVILVIAGFSATGAVVSLLVSFVVTYLISFVPIRFIFDRKTVHAPVLKTKELFAYGFPSALTLFGLMSFISSDIILVKHFFNPTEAGLYAGLSLVGRVIFYLSAPIGSVMFPVIVQKHSKKENFTNTFMLSLLLVFLPSLLLTIFYAFFPKFSVLFFLKKSEYVAISSLVAPFGLFIALFSLLSIISNFYLSIKKTKVFIPILVGAILHIILIYFYHQTFFQIINISLIITLVLICGLLLYYPYAAKK